MTLTVEWIEDTKRWDELAAEWDDVVMRSAHPNIFCTWEFLRTCWDRFARPYGHRLAIFAVMDQNRLAGFAPLRISSRRRLGFTLRRLSILPAWGNDRVHFVEPKGKESEFYELLMENLQLRMDRWDVLELPEYPADGAFLHALEAWSTTRRDLSLSVEEGSPSPYIRLPETWEKLTGSLSKNLRKNLKRHKRKMSERGPIELEVFTSPDEMSAAVELYVELEGRSWKRNEAVGINKDGRNLDFNRDLFTRLSRKGQCNFHFLKQNETRVAANIDARLGNVVYSLQTVYDDEFKCFSPGNVLMELGIKWHIDRGARIYELFSECLENKILWTKEQHRNTIVSLVQRRRVKHFVAFRKAWAPPVSIKARVGVDQLVDARSAQTVE